MRYVLKITVMICLLTLFVVPISAQDSNNETGYEEALRRIKEAGETQETFLSLSHLELTAIPPEIGQLTHLESLIAQGNQLTDIPPEILNLTNLRVLDLGWNQLGSIPPEIYVMTQLESLTLYDNKLQEVPNRIGRLTNLTFLGLSGNELDELPKEIGLLIHLEQLHLEVNELKSLPAEIGNLQNLCLVHLSSNQLERLPAELGQVTRLGDNNCSGITLHENPLISPPPAVVRQGTHAVLAYLRDEETSRDNRLRSGLGALAIVIMSGIAMMVWQKPKESGRKSKRKRGE